MENLKENVFRVLSVRVLKNFVYSLSRVFVSVLIRVSSLLLC